MLLVCCVSTLSFLLFSFIPLTTYSPSRRENHPGAALKCRHITGRTSVLEKWSFPITLSPRVDMTCSSSTQSSPHNNYPIPQASRAIHPNYHHPHNHTRG